MERDVIDIVTQKLNEIPEMDFQILTIAERAKGRSIDGKIRVKRNQYQRDWYVEFKTQLTPAMLPGLLSQRQDIKPMIVMAEYITPNAKKILQKENIAYADAAGNIFLADDRLFILIETNKAERKYTTTSNRAFTQAGLKILYVLLQHSEYVNEPYRFTAEKAIVGLDTISKVYKALKKEKYIIPINEKEYKWNKREELLINWIEGYIKNLKPKLRKRTFKALDNNQHWQDIPLPLNTCWGGANAGEILTGNLIADHWTLYTEQDFMTLMKAFKWIPDPNGKITVIEKFWKDDNQDNHVPPLIAYADLIEEDNPRYIETAKIMYEKQLKDLI